LESSQQASLTVFGLTATDFINVFGFPTTLTLGINTVSQKQAQSICLQMYNVYPIIEIPQLRKSRAEINLNNG
jgi:hypothetical protein